MFSFNLDLMSSPIKTFHLLKQDSNFGFRDLLSANSSLSPWSMTNSHNMAFNKQPFSFTNLLAACSTSWTHPTLYSSAHCSVKRQWTNVIWWPTVDSQSQRRVNLLFKKKKRHRVWKYANAVKLLSLEHTEQYTPSTHWWWHQPFLSIQTPAAKKEKRLRMFH